MERTELQAVTPGALLLADSTGCSQYGKAFSAAAFGTGGQREAFAQCLLSVSSCKGGYANAQGVNLGFQEPWLSYSLLGRGHLIVSRKQEPLH